MTPRLAELAKQHEHLLLHIAEVAERQKITAPADLVALVGPRFHETQEQLYVVLLDTKNNVLGVELITQGTGNSSIVKPREVFRPAILAGATCVAMLHNHPSGDPMPSPADVNLTHEIRKGGELLGIDLVDHVVVGSLTRWFSLRERGLGFTKEAVA